MDEVLNSVFIDSREAVVYILAHVMIPRSLRGEALLPDATLTAAWLVI